MSAPRVLEGEIVARGRKVAIVAARFNDFIVASLLKGATAAWLERGGPAEDVLVARVPGAFERLLHRLDGEHAEDDGHTGLQACKLQSARALARDILEMRRVPANDTAERHDGIIPA